ncbi:hypothetical protein GCM10010420_56290 [Streptomyces glaucosporus]|uniref:Uncharacterized protein n=1 Tax=Streptomyces glaucosporus TaxID=284044 RepID=A0ABN3IZS3_9ACTN
MCLILPREGESVDYPEGNEWPMPHLADCGMRGDRDLGLEGSRRGKKVRTTVRAAREHGVAVESLAAHCADDLPQAGLLFGYGTIRTEHITGGLRLLAR